MKRHANIEIEFNILFGENKGKRTSAWFMYGDPEINRILNDKRMEAVVIWRQRNPQNLK